MTRLLLGGAALCQIALALLACFLGFLAIEMPAGVLDHATTGQMLRVAATIAVPLLLVVSTPLLLLRGHTSKAWYLLLAIDLLLVAAGLLFFSDTTSLLLSIDVPAGLAAFLLFLPPLRSRFVNAKPHTDEALRTP